MHYILVDKQILEVNYFEYCKWETTANRLINETTIDDMKIITRFTGRNIFAFTSDRLLFETTIEGGLFDGYSDYSSTYEEALKTHEEVCAKVTFYKP